MNSILGFSQRLVRKDVATFGNREAELIETIAKSAAFMTRQIHDMLDLERSESGGLLYESIEFSLRDLARESLEIARGSQEGASPALRLELDDGLSMNMTGDPHRLKQILLNLLSNALKFTVEEHVVLRVKSENRSKQRIKVLFEVSDTGIGMDPGTPKKIFDRFSQGAVSISREYGGTSLGLAISRTLAVGMGGTLTAESVLDQGTTLRLGLEFGISQKQSEELTS